MLKGYTFSLQLTKLMYDELHVKLLHVLCNKSKCVRKHRFLNFSYFYLYLYDLRFFCKKLKVMQPLRKTISYKWPPLATSQMSTHVILVLL